MALAPHLSLYVVVLVFIMACIGCPLVGSTWLLLFVGGLCVVGGIGCGEGCGLWGNYVGIVLGLCQGFLD